MAQQQQQQPKNNLSDEKKKEIDPHEEALVRCETSAGTFSMKFHRYWSPLGYDRTIELFERNFYDHSHFYRVVPNFLIQFGISYSNDKQLQHFSKQSIKDDPQLNPPISFREGIISFAGSGPNSRTSHLFIAYGYRKSFGTQLWETPIGEVIEGMDNLRHLFSYGDIPPFGNGPEQGKIYNNRPYMEQNFPKTDEFYHCKVERISPQLVYEQKQKQNNNLRQKKQNNVKNPNVKTLYGIQEEIPIPNNFFSKIQYNIKKLYTKQDDYREMNENYYNGNTGIIAITSSIILVVVVIILLLTINSIWKCKNRRTFGDKSK